MHFRSDEIADRIWWGGSATPKVRLIASHSRYSRTERSPNVRRHFGASDTGEGKHQATSARRSGNTCMLLRRPGWRTSLGLAGNPSGNSARTAWRTYSDAWIRYRGSGTRRSIVFAPWWKNEELW
jgi:hypothetical protein